MPIRALDATNRGFGSEVTTGVYVVDALVSADGSHVIAVAGFDHLNRRFEHADCGS